jgi:hypothetical protein
VQLDLIPPAFASVVGLLLPDLDCCIVRGFFVSRSCADKGLGLTGRETEAHRREAPTLAAKSTADAEIEHRNRRATWAEPEIQTRRAGNRKIHQQKNSGSKNESFDVKAKIHDGKYQSAPARNKTKFDPGGSTRSKAKMMSHRNTGERERSTEETPRSVHSIREINSTSKMQKQRFLSHSL